MDDDEWVMGEYIHTYIYSLYNNVEWKYSQGKQNEPPPTTPKTGLHSKKVMQCMWRDQKGVLYYELLLENRMINSNNYCSKLNPLKAVLNEKHPELANRKLIIFHQDKTRPHVSLITKQKLLQLGCSSEVLIHLLYNRHCTFGFSLFWSSENSLYEKNIQFPRSP